MKPFSKYNDAELLGISNEELNDAIRLEAIERELKIPVTLSNALKTSEWRGYQRPAESSEVWEIQVQSRYGSPKRTGIGYLTKELAVAALNGIVSIDNEGYGSTAKDVISIGTPSISLVLIGESPSQSKAAKFEEYCQDDTEFNNLTEECVEKYSAVRQEAYNQKVRRERAVEYLRLAQGDETIAKAFWDRSERTEWPAAA